MPDAPLATGSTAPTPAPRTLERAVGAQVRALRRALDLSLGDLAAAAGLSTGMVSKIENGQISASLTTLGAVAAALQAPLGSLFAAFDERQDCSHVPAGYGVAIERRGTKAGHIYELIGHALGGDLVVEPYLITLTGDARPHTGFHHAGVEFLYMLSGALDYRHGDRVYPLRPGDALLFDSVALHGPETLVELPATYLSIIVYNRVER